MEIKSIIEIWFCLFVYQLTSVPINYGISRSLKKDRDAHDQLKMYREPDHVFAFILTILHIYVIEKAHFQDLFNYGNIGLFFRYNRPKYCYKGNRLIGRRINGILG